MKVIFTIFFFFSFRRTTRRNKPLGSWNSPHTNLFYNGNNFAATSESYQDMLKILTKIFWRLYYRHFVEIQMNKPKEWKLNQKFLFTFNISANCETRNQKWKKQKNKTIQKKTKFLHSNKKSRNQKLQIVSLYPLNAKDIFWSEETAEKTNNFRRRKLVCLSSESRVPNSHVIIVIL